MSDVLQRLRSLPLGAPLDWRKIREEIHNEHERATTTNQRVTLLGIYQTVMDTVERSGGIAREDLGDFKDARLKDYRLLIVREALVGENVCAETLNAITEREVAAGRMAPYDTLRRTATLGMAAPHLSRAELIALDAEQRSYIATPPAPPKSGWRSALAWLRRK